MLINGHRAISPHQDMKLLLVSRTCVCSGCEMSEPALANTLEKIDISVTNSFICRVNPIYPDISGNHPFHSVHRILKRPQSPGAGYVSIIMAMIHNIDILKPACSLAFHKGEIEQIKYTVSWQQSKSLEPFSNYLDMRCITKNLQKWLHMSRCSLWLTENCLRG